MSSTSPVVVGTGVAKSLMFWKPSSMPARNNCRLSGVGMIPNSAPSVQNTAVR